MKILTSSVLALIAFVFTGVTSVAQYSSSVFELKKASELYDERGYNVGKALNVDGNLIVNNGSGTVSYSYPISDSKSKGFPLRVSLNYNSSVAFTTFKKYNYLPIDVPTGSMYDGWEKFHQNRPAWIIGVNGFAVQTLTATAQFHNDPLSYNNTSKYRFSDSDFVWLMDGYDFCNRMANFYRPGEYEENANVLTDVIRLLREDGSVLELRKNSPQLYNPTTAEELEQVTGYYHVNEANAEGFAIVEAYTPNFPHYVSNVSGSGTYNMPRQVKYYPGDGLEYIFREWSIPYGMNPYTDDLGANPAPGMTYGGVLTGPTIFYLEEINASNSRVATFNRSRHYPMMLGEFGGEDSTRGRALLTDFDNHKLLYGNNWLQVEALGRTTTIHFNKVVLQGQARTDITSPLKGFGEMNAQAWYLAGMRDNEVSYKSYMGLVTKIVDPEKRATTFDYESYVTKYHDFGFPHNPSGSNQEEMTLRNWRLKQIIEPTQKFDITYYRSKHWLVQSPSDTLVPDTSTISATSGVGTQDPTNPYVLNNIVRRVEKYDTKGTKLLTEEYNYEYVAVSPACFSAGTAPDRKSIWKTHKITNDHLAGTADTIGFRYESQLVNCDALWNPPVYFTKLMETGRWAAGEYHKTVMDYTFPNGTLIALPSSEETYVSGSGVTNKLKSIVTHSYSYEVVRPFGGVDSLKTKYGQSVSKKRTVVKRPNSPSYILRRDTTVYMALPYLDTLVARTEYIWDKFASMARYFERRADGWQGRWEDHMYDSTENGVGVYSWVNDTIQRIIPPYYGLVKRSTVTDTTGRIVTGIENTYSTAIVNDHDLTIRGRVLTETDLGRNNTWETPKKVRAEYEYGKRNEMEENLVVAHTNGNGSRTTYRYDYNLPELFDSQVGYGYSVPSARYRTNDNYTLDTTLQSPEYLAAAYGQPVVEQQEVRSYRGGWNFAWDTTRLTTLYERTYYGLAKSVVDPNGWYSRFNYDRNGRIETAWTQGDYPQGGGRDTMTYEGTEVMEMLGVTNYNARHDTLYWHFVNGNYTDSTIIGPVVNSTDLFRFYAAKPVTVIPGQPDGCGTSTKEKGGGTAQILQTCIRKLPYPQYSGFTGYTGILNYTKGDDSPFNYVDQADSLHLDVSVSSVVGTCVNLVVSIPAISFSTTYVFNCTGGGDLPTGTEKDGAPRIASVLPAAEGDLLHINLTPKISQILALSSTANMEIQFSVTTSGGEVNLSNGDIAEDMRPRLVLQGVFNKPSETDDYTVWFDHKDDSLTTAIRSKVDDIRHTESYYATSSTLGDIRRMDTKHRFGAGGRLLKSEATMVTPGQSSVIDSVMYGYTGSGARRRVKDQEGDTTVTAYDALGRPVQITNADGSTSTVSYAFLDPTSVSGFADQDWYGLIRSTTFTNETGIQTIKYYDAQDSLRREVVDAQGLALATRYNYDVLGRLTHVVNPKGDTTRYWYDDFGRVRYKRQPDIGTISYAYDIMGNLRFSQTQQQSDDSLMTYYQYDDLNRMVVTGEVGTHSWSTLPPMSTDSAHLPFLNRYSDMFMPDMLHIHSDGYNGSITVNPTLNDSIGPDTTQSLWSYSQQGTTMCSLPMSPMLGEQTAPVGPFMKHPAFSYEPTISGGGYFENYQDDKGSLRTVVSYDKLPTKSQRAWSGFPDTADWNRIAPTGKVRNTLGREVAVAYREHGGEPFHYSVMSYDERGRPEALLRYTENLGFDAVYYTYNSLNEVTSVRVADPLRQHTTWYGYDANGRVDSVWTQLQGVGSGLGISQPSYPTMIARTQSQVSAADIAYTYTPTGRVASMSYPPVGVQVGYDYTSRKWLEQITATRNTQGNPVLFMQYLTYNPSGQITQQVWSRTTGTFPFYQMLSKSHTYTYDGADRLVGWKNGLSAGTDSTKYIYDVVGNRMNSKLFSGVDSTMISYAYGAGGSNRLAQRNNHATGGGGVLSSELYTYDADGAAVAKNVVTGGGPVSSEQYTYSYRELLRSYKSMDVANPANPPLEWRYRSSALSEREQKRLYAGRLQRIPTAYDTLDTRPWVYYLLGGLQEQLAVYHGLETSDSLCGENGSSRVYLYPTEYNTYSGSISQITTRPDATNPAGNKEFKVTDHLGSTRVVLDAAGATVETTDYEPFGKPLTGGTARQSYIDKERDRENNLGDFGVRKYDYDIGRFMTVDPLWERFRASSPYVYSDNNPVRFSDPSGAAVGGGFSIKNETNEDIVLQGEGKVERRNGLFGADWSIELRTYGGATGNGTEVRKIDPIVLRAGETFSPTVTGATDGNGNSYLIYGGIITSPNGESRPTPIFDVDGIRLTGGQQMLVNTLIGNNPQRVTANSPIDRNTDTHIALRPALESGVMGPVGTIRISSVPNSPIKTMHMNVSIAPAHLPTTPTIRPLPR